MTTIGEIALTTTSPSDAYLIEMENPSIASYKITWNTILSLTKTHSQADLSPVAFSGSYSDLTDIPSIEAGGHTIQDEGVDLSTRTYLNFVGSSVTVTDDEDNDATVVTISAGSSWSNGGTKTSDFTAIDNTIYYLNPSLSYITVTLPSSGKVKLIDIIGNSPSTGCGEKNVTILPSIGTIMGDSELILDKGGLSIELEFINTDWRLV
jgi:hypothetical protein